MSRRRVPAPSRAEQARAARRGNEEVRGRRKQGGRQKQARRPVKRVRPGVRNYQQGAQTRLRRFRQGSALAVALTALMLMIWVGEQEVMGQEEAAASGAGAEEARELLPSDPAASLEQATGTVRDLVLGFYAMLPRLLIAVILVALAVGVGKAVRAMIQRSLGRWERTHAISALVQIGIFLLATAAALSVLAGDARALLGSIGLVGLALSWALQTPIESFTGWLMNSFRVYYRVGDRIEVGEVFGDVYKIDVLTTTVWEAGGPGKPVAGAQATGAMITFPNWEVLRSNIINYSRDFPYVWDEVTVNVANESDLRYTVEVFEGVARRLFGRKMSEPAREYQELLERARLAFDVDDEPKAFISLADAWTDCTVRYLVPARARRRWASELSIALTEESEKPEHRGKIIAGYPRQELRMIGDWQAEAQR
jgi:small conductance mechanosensitive channel